MPERQYDLVRATADYRAWNGAPRRTLVICTQQRSGSTLLGEAIYFAGGFGCPLEYFHVGFRPAFERRWKTNGLPAYAQMVHRFRTDPSGVFSVKLFWWDIIELTREMAPSEFGWLTRATSSGIDASVYRRIHATIAGLIPNPVFIRLTRRDTVAQAVSLSIAMGTRRWRKLASDRDVQHAPYTFDSIVQRLAQIQNEHRHWLNFFQANEIEPFTIEYEELAEEYDAALRRLFAWLDRPDAPITAPRLRKQADAQSEQVRHRFLAEFQQRAKG